MTRHTVFLIHGGDLTINGVGPNETGKFSGWITFWKDSRPHIAPLYSTDYIYDSEDEAKETMRAIVDDIRNKPLEYWSSL